MRFKSEKWKTETWNIIVNASVCLLYFRIDNWHAFETGQRDRATEQEIEGERETRTYILSNRYYFCVAIQLSFAGWQTQFDRPSERPLDRRRCKESDFSPVRDRMNGRNEHYTKPMTLFVGIRIISTNVCAYFCFVIIIACCGRCCCFFFLKPHFKSHLQRNFFFFFIFLLFVQQQKWAIDKLSGTLKILQK